MNTNTALAINFCPSCGHALQPQARFCSQCGRDVTLFASTKKLSAKSAAIILTIGAAVFAVGWYAQEPLIGKAPTEHFKAENSAKAEEEPLEPALKALKDAAEKTPTEKAGWVTLAGAITERLTMKDPPQGLIFEAIGALRKILDIDPKDKDALLTMAEISFQQQAFAKSADFYQKYLEVVPEDLDMRARLASSLSFLGKFEDALKELNRVLAVKPAHFHALAYSAVTYAEMGNREKAKELGAKALAVAPNAEAKERFSTFLKSLEAKPEAGAKPQAASAQSSFEPAVQTVVDQIKNNPVAGKKFISAALEGKDTLRISLDNFPMDQMPPFVREKFLNAIKEKAFVQESPLKTVVLFDQTRNLPLEKIERAGR